MQTKFQKRHYSALATIVRIARKRPNDSVAECLLDIEADLADLFARDNPKFKRSQFLRACQPREAVR